MSGVRLQHYMQCLFLGLSIRGSPGIAARSGHVSCQGRGLPCGPRCGPEGTSPLGGGNQSPALPLVLLLGFRVFFSLGGEQRE